MFESVGRCVGGYNALVKRLLRANTLQCMKDLLEAHCGFSKASMHDKQLRHTKDETKAHLIKKGYVDANLNYMTPK